MEKTLAGASLCLITSGPEMRELVAGVLAEHRLLFERRGAMLALVGARDPARAVELLRHVLPYCGRRDVMVASTGESGFPERHTLDDWWRIHETAWFEDAVAAGSFTTWFQPILDTSRDEIHGYECLVRLQLGERGARRTYSGAEIFDAARLRGKEGALDGQLSTLAIRTAARMDLSTRYFVNILPNSIHKPEACLAGAFETISEIGLPPSRVIFEAVGAPDIDPVHLLAISDAVRARGCGFSLDDLGVTNGGLQLIRDLQPDYVKLASDLTADIESPACATAIRRLVEATDQTETVMIATQVEGRVMVENLWLLGVQYMQGYHCGRPAPAPVSGPFDLASWAAALGTPLAMAHQYCN